MNEAEQVAAQLREALSPWATDPSAERRRIAAQAEQVARTLLEMPTGIAALKAEIALR